MDSNAFWRLIDRVHAAAPEEMGTKCELLGAELRKLSDDDLRDFRPHFDDADTRAYDWKLWAAAYVLNGGCSDDGFSDFRASLISRGRAAFEATLTDPDSLADAEPGREFFYEGYQYVWQQVAQARWGSLPPRGKSLPPSPSGQDWTEADLPTLLPRLAGEADAPVSTTAGSAESRAAPHSLAEWRSTPLPPRRKFDLLAFAMTWTLPNAAEEFATAQQRADAADWDEPGAKSGFKQALRSLDDRLEGHERLIDDALRAKGLLTFTELQAHDGKAIEGILKHEKVATFFQFDLAQRVLTGGVPLSADERKILTTAIAAYQPGRSTLFDDIDDDEA